MLDAGRGESFNARDAGNISNRDMLGSMEFTCAITGATSGAGDGQTRCCAVRDTIDNAQLGNLTGLLEEIKRAIDKTVYSGERSGSNYDFVNTVARE